jgi:AraC family transcriptional regulator, activator of mtrCDE
MTLDDLLAHALIRVHVVFRGFACGRWGLAPSQRGRVGFHLVLSGQCWAQSPDLPNPVLMRAGGIMVFKPAAQYALTDTETRTAALAPTRVLPLSGEPRGPHVGLLCGYFDGGSANASLLNALPQCHVWADAAACSPPMAALVAAIARCAASDDAANTLIVERLCSVLLLMILRSQAVVSRERAGELRAEQHPALRRALLALRTRPAAPWTVQSLASVARLSRSSFAELFKRECGQPPLSYLRDYRMTLAAEKLGKPDADLKRVARLVGYGNLAAFKRQLAKASGNRVVRSA